MVERHRVDAAATVSPASSRARPGEPRNQVQKAASETSPQLGPPFGPPERMELRWHQLVSHQEILDMVASRSYVISMLAPERAELLAEVAELLSEHPDLRGREEIAMPYISRCTRVHVAGPDAV